MMLNNTVFQNEKYWILRELWKKRDFEGAHKRRAKSFDSWFAIFYLSYFFLYFLFSPNSLPLFPPLPPGKRHQTDGLACDCGGRPSPTASRERSTWFTSFSSLLILNPLDFCSFLIAFSSDTSTDSQDKSSLVLRTSVSLKGLRLGSKVEQSQWNQKIILRTHFSRLQI